MKEQEASAPGNLDEVMSRLQATPRTQGGVPLIGGQAPDPITLLTAQVNQLAGFAQYLQQGMMEIASNFQQMGMALDVARLQIEMLTSLVQENDLISEEDYKVRYESDVADRLRTMYAAAEEEAKGQECPGPCGDCKEDCATREEPCVPCEDCEDCNLEGVELVEAPLEDTEPVLASERAAAIDKERGV
ncbi:MAG: hypothetical protein DRI24_09480 [Deltaproteobacteria bacterium]|nr:MAG: hypothetical protein DRI24_09480 [Deltaproteobacteria bacterium]